MFNNVSCTYLMVLCCNNLTNPLVLSIEGSYADVSLLGQQKRFEGKLGFIDLVNSKQSVKNKFQVVRVKSSYASRSGVLSGPRSSSL